MVSALLTIAFVNESNDSEKVGFDEKEHKSNKILMKICNFELH